MGLPTTILTVVDDIAGRYVTTVFSPVVAKISTPLWAAVTLFIAIYGYLVMTGHIQQLFKTTFKNMFVIGFVTYTALNWEWFAYLYDVATSTPDMFASVVSFGKDKGFVLDEIFDRGMMTAFAIWQKSGTFDLAMWSLGFAVFIVSIWLVGSAVFLLTLAKFFVAINLGIGPIFIAFYLFSTTRQWFKNWIGSLVGLIIFQILVYAALGLGHAVYNALIPTGELYTANALDPNQIQQGILPFLLIFISLTFVLGRTDSHAQSLIGSMGYIGDAASSLYNKTSSAMSRAGRRGPTVGQSYKGARAVGKWMRNKLTKKDD